MNLRRMLGVAILVFLASPFATAQAGGLRIGIGIGLPIFPVYRPYYYPYPAYYAPRPVYVQPYPVYVQPAPVYVQPAPVYQTPAPQYATPAPQGYQSLPPQPVPVR